MSANKKEYVAQMLESIRRIRHIAREEFANEPEYGSLEDMAFEIDTLLRLLQARLEIRIPR